MSANQVTKRRAFTGTLILLTVLVAAILLFYSPHTSRQTYPQSTNYQSVSIHDLKQLNPTSGLYNTEGYVAKTYSCPPCPSGAICKPYMPDNIVISEQKKTLEIYTLTDTEMVIFVSHPEQFTLGGKYTYSIQVSDTHSTGDSINDVRLVGYSP